LRKRSAVNVFVSIVVHGSYNLAETRLREVR